MTYNIELEVTKVFSFIVEADDSVLAIEKAQAVAERRKKDPSLSEKIEGEMSVIEIPLKERWKWNGVDEY